MKYFILYNPLACSRKCDQYAKAVILPKNSEKYLVAMTDGLTYEKVLNELSPDDKVVLCGGDGTLNRFINSVDLENLKNEILYAPAGSGNDFLNDIGGAKPNVPVSINKYLKNLPIINLNNKLHRFINGVGYGIDGYCCEVVNRLKSLSKKASYTLIALKGLIYAYKPTNAFLKIDGKEFNYKKVWLTPIMKGRFFGGGMMIAPMQDRNNSDGSLTVIVAHNLSKLKIVTLFPTIFKGNHIKYKKHIAVHTGHNISVKFDVPTAMQIDGETVLGITEYSVSSNAIKANR